MKVKRKNCAWPIWRKQHFVCLHKSGCLPLCIVTHTHTHIRRFTYIICSMCVCLLLYLFEENNNILTTWLLATYMHITFCKYIYISILTHMHMYMYMYSMCMWVMCDDRGRTLSSGMFCCALFLNLPIVSVKGSQGDDIMQQAVFEVPVLKEPLIAIRISLNKRLRNIGWFLAFASRSCLLTSEVWSPIIIYPSAPHSWQLPPWRGLNAGATHWLHQSVRNCNIKNNNWYSGGRLLFEYFL